MRPFSYTQLGQHKMKQTVHLDFETRSAVPFGKSAGKHGVSAYQYSLHPTTEVLWASYAFGDEPVKQWRAYRGDPFPDDLRQAVADGHIIAAHNANFEQLIWENTLAARYGLPPLPIEQMDCTAVRAAIMALPRALDGVTRAMGMAEKKDIEGHRLMLKMSKPRKARKHEDPHGLYWHEDPEDMERLGQYCDQDVEAERGLDKVLIRISPYQRQQWLRVHRANMRGVEVDIPFVMEARRIGEWAQDQYSERLIELTDGTVSSAKAVPALKKWLKGHGLVVESLDKAHTAALLEQTKDRPAIQEVLLIRQAAGKSSVAKYDRFEVLSDQKNRMRENFLFHAANTGRAGGRGAQLQNLPSRGGLPWYHAEDCINMIREAKSPEWMMAKIELLYGEIPTALSSCLRGVIKAAAGKKLFVADYSNIEGRVAAWLGDEFWKLEAFRLFDAGLGPDLYKVTAGQIVGRGPETINKVERNVLGKVPELALGFGGGVGAFDSMAKIYGVNMADYWDIIQEAISDNHIEKARWGWGKYGAAQAKASGMPQEAWLAAETVKNAWRERHPGIVACWNQCEQLSVKALQNPGKWHPWSRGRCHIGAKVIGGKTFLLYRLPSGRILYRADASLKAIKKFGREALEIRFWGVDSVSSQWVRQSTYGGDTFQSFVQAIAYDLMDNGWATVEEAGYDVILTVHDEIGAEADEHRTLAEFEAGMNALPAWADGCPVSSEGYVSERYRKDG